MYFKNMSDTAAWPMTYVDHNRHIQMDSPSPWSVVEGYHFETLVWDWLHNVYLGIARDLVASGILVLIEHNCVPLGDGLDGTLANLHRQIRKTCSKNGFLGFVYIYCLCSELLCLGCAFFGFGIPESSMYSVLLFPTNWLPRVYLPCKPFLTKANVGGIDDYAVLGSRFKAATVKTLVWWLSTATQTASDQNPAELWC